MQDRGGNDDGPANAGVHCSVLHPASDIRHAAFFSQRPASDILHPASCIPRPRARARRSHTLLRMDIPRNAFKRALHDSARLVGLWHSIRHAAVTEILADSPLDWIL